MGWGERVTVRREVVAGRVWSLEQEQALDVLAMNIRATVVKLQGGGLVVFSPQAPTVEFCRLLDELGPVAHIVLPTYALEHKVYVAPMARRYPAAQVWVAPGIWSAPLDLPLNLLGINAMGAVGPGQVPPPPWADEIDCKVLRVDTAGANPYIEACFLHRPTRTLLVTDLVLRIPQEPPEVISRPRLLSLAADDPAAAPAPMSAENLRVGWAKASLVVNFLGPAHQQAVAAGDFKGKLEWEPGYMDSFAAVSGRLIASPILRTLVFSKGRGATRRFLDEVCADWGDSFDTIVPAHYDAPIAAGWCRLNPV